MSIFIAHAVFLPERRASLARLLEQVPKATVVASETREHASTWAARLYKVALESEAPICTFLNDDVRVCPYFEDTVSAMHGIHPHGPLSLHVTHPAAEGMMQAGLRWFRSYWLTGPAYSMSRQELLSLVEYRSRLPRWFVESRNEDNLAMHWMWERQTPAWHSLPSITTHDITVPSTLGYDQLPLRSAKVLWHSQNPEHMRRVSFWHEAHVPLLRSCPWMTSRDFEYWERMTR